MYMYLQFSAAEENYVEHAQVISYKQKYTRIENALGAKLLSHEI